MTKRLTFLKFDYRKYSNFLLLYKSSCHLRLKWTQGKTFYLRDIYNFLRALQNDIGHVGGAVLICIAIDFMLSWHTRRFQYSL